TYQSILSTMSEFYCQGYTIASEVLFSGLQVKIVHLPTYPFLREEYWVTEKPATAKKNTPREVVDVADELKKVVSSNGYHHGSNGKAVAENGSVTHLAVMSIDEVALHMIKDIISEVVSLPKEKVEDEVALEHYGIDSILTVQVRNMLEEVFGELPAELFFEYPTVKDLTQYFVANYPEELSSLQVDKTPAENDVYEKVAKRVKLDDYLKKLISAVINLPYDQIETDVLLEQYGIDSILMVQLRNQLESDFEELPAELFFEYPSIEMLKGYFETNHSEKLQELESRPLIEEDNAEVTEEASSEPINAVAYLKSLISNSINLPVEKIEGDVSISQYGIDSILIVQLRNQITHDFFELPDDFFFEYQTISEMADALNHGEQVGNESGMNSQKIGPDTEFDMA
ncbi:MAG: phosphopantetheine-binding protein, partial [Bacteroidota bacterium]